MVGAGSFVDGSIFMHFTQFQNALLQNAPLETIENIVGRPSVIAFIQQLDDFPVHLSMLHKAVLFQRVDVVKILLR